MLDYAQFSAGQYKQFINEFDIFESVTEIINILNFKAESLGIQFRLKFLNFDN